MPIARPSRALLLPTLTAVAFAGIPSAPLHAQAADSARTLDDAARALREAPALFGARIGFVVQDLDSGDTLVEFDSDRGFMTASNMKLVSSSVALQTLGPDYRYRTTLVGSRAVEDGTLHGDLVLVGSGDPTFGGRQEKSRTAVFERMVDELVTRHGLERVDGNILGDDNCHPDEVMGEGWAWGYQSDTYAAQVSGLCFAENVVTLRITPGAPGASPTVRFEPGPAGFFSASVDAVTGAAGVESSVWAQRARATNRVRIGGTLAADARPVTRRCSVENPTAYAVSVLAEVLRARGIEVTGRALDRDLEPVRPDRYGDEVVLAEHRSAPLGEILVTLNKASQNLYAEQVIRTAARVARGSGGMRAATAHATATLSALGVDTAGMRIADGSGLSRLDLVQPRHLAALLRGMWNSEHRETFFATLPIGGVDGTLGRRFGGTAAEGRVHAKTGYISSVVGLSGYLEDRSGTPKRVFSILVNNFTRPTADVKRAVDAFVIAALPD